MDQKYRSYGSATFVYSSSLSRVWLNISTFVRRISVSIPLIGPRYSKQKSERDSLIEIEDILT